MPRVKGNSPGAPNSTAGSHAARSSSVRVCSTRGIGAIVPRLHARVVLGCASVYKCAAFQEVGMADDDRLRLDYEQTLAQWRSTAVLRFQLFMILPIAAGLGMTVFYHLELAGGMQASMGVLGFVSTWGAIAYDQAAADASDALAARIMWLEAKLGLF